MTTTERGLFKRIEIAIKITAAKSSGYEAAVANTWNVIRATCEEFEQRLAEAEAERDKVSAQRAKLEQLVIQTFDAKDDEITQLRARCGELEKTTNRIAHELETYNPAADEHHGKYIHKGWAKQLRAITATPQPAQEQKG